MVFRPYRSAHRVRLALKIERVGEAAGRKNRKCELLFIGEALRFGDAVHPLLLAIDFPEERLPFSEPADVDSLRQSQGIDAKVRLGRIGGDLPGIVPGPQEAGMLPGPGERAFLEKRRKIDAAGDAVVPRTQVGESGRVTGPVVARGHLVEKAPGLRRPGQDVMRGHQVIVVTVRQGADEGVLMSPCGEARQVLADVQPGRGGGDWLKLAANLGRRPGLHVERVVMARRAGQKDDDDGLRARRRGTARAGRFSRLGPTGQTRGEPDTEQRGGADLQPFAAAEAGGMFVEGGGRRRHQAGLSGVGR